MLQAPPLQLEASRARPAAAVEGDDISRVDRRPPDGATAQRHRVGPRRRATPLAEEQAPSSARLAHVVPSAPGPPLDDLGGRAARRSRRWPGSAARMALPAGVPSVRALRSPRASASADARTFAESLSSSDSSRSSGRPLVPPGSRAAPGRTAGLRQQIRRGGGPRARPACAKAARHRPALRPSRNASASERGTQADTRAGPCGPRRRRAGCPGHSPPSRSSTGGQPRRGARSSASSRRGEGPSAVASSGRSRCGPRPAR